MFVWYKAQLHITISAHIMQYDVFCVAPEENNLKETLVVLTNAHMSQ